VAHTNTLQHPLQFLHALLYLRLQLAEGFEDFARRAVRAPVIAAFQAA
jgi:hypothetical protein